MTKRRTFSPHFRAQIALKGLRGDMSQAALCREHNLGPDLVSRWCQQLVDRAFELFPTPASQSAEQARIEELERLLGQLTFELSAARRIPALLSSRSTRNGR